MDPHLDPSTAVVSPVEEATATPMEVDEPVSVMDERAFAARHLADLGQEEEDFRVMHWDIKDWSDLEKRLTGPEFECGGHRW